MGFLARLLGNQPPKLRAGARAYADGLYVKHSGELFCVRYKAPGDPDPGTRIGPTFQTASGASMYATWLNGEGELDWGINGKGMPV
jgi:hypothetical protein